MSNLVPTPRSGVAARSLSRGASRALAFVDDRTSVDLARIESAAELQLARVQAVAYVGKHAMQEVAMVSQMEQQLSTMVPLATSRLQAIGDMMALSAAEVVAGMLRKVSK